MLKCLELEQPVSVLELHSLPFLVDAFALKFVLRSDCDGSFGTRKTSIDEWIFLCTEMYFFIFFWFPLTAKIVRVVS